MAEKVIEVRHVDKFYRTGEISTQVLFDINLEVEKGTFNSIIGASGSGVGESFYGERVRGLEFRVAWTWSKAIDFGQSGGATPRTNGQFDPFNVRYDKGLSSLNYPHRVVASAVWMPPQPKRC